MGISLLIRTGMQTIIAYIYLTIAQGPKKQDIKYINRKMAGNKFFVFLVWIIYIVYPIKKYKYSAGWKSIFIIGMNL